MEVKNRRVTELIQAFRSHALMLNQSQIGSVHLVLVEGESRRSKDDMMGRNDYNVRVNFPRQKVPLNSVSNSVFSSIEPGNYVAVKITRATSQTLYGKALFVTSLTEFYNKFA